MATSDLFSRGQLKAVVRRELMDPTGTWWADPELEEYLGAWQDYLQERFEFVWNTATVTTSLSTLTLTAVATDINRLDAIYWNGIRIGGRDKLELEILQRDWRASPALVPVAAYQDDFSSISFWPPPPTAGTAIFEYPARLTFTDDSAAMAIPAWTKYSAVNYCVYRALLRAGPNQDLKRAARRKAKFLKQVERYRTIFDQYLPTHAPTLRPGGKYEGDILAAGRNNSIYRVWY